MHKFNVVLYRPEIPGNTGTIGRSCLALNARLILIRPYGFDLSEKSVRRAGLDYWKYVQLTEYDSWEDFMASEKPTTSQLFFLSTKAQKNYYHAAFSPSSYLVFGQETKGLPKSLFEEFPSQFFKIPMYSDKVRSLNLANAATAVMYEAIRQIDYTSQTT
ncbi:MAG: tRNA (uridine(34)/cytosine(34)/5-carboxymethylaminomethyluridine(34)-2'-O)-methyltransferase TrmL [Bdellovibrionales bacterium RIFOXYD12_FULL_39_22]|nr:MAG: tRNA (uridine(34)/cytosine(34)/5-carboxymethylaminomethyluridine(34)-2'-O)-methyltransferase TrmL [Bdellovibrionales bacterium RIFOXYB1_FULL_39_21]OFZ41732.1 MAG: tRNA (uridine(34)/cytosine(34)/5-carboxymethylaminomethyluridine(34)-2'-O)-methyltransferase TrmL [Bdellovibrionales bacterium RIFOXYC12_FULL_39_17]OFZ46132.1 MAG: tRNA (uridine(34)/cytosine(34)/5-carboxymethylaminomethyluridine(34)-2'-O)-methyltransferase TrmL [Bdellovibrionales bacterium RIFOXYC1_FULL_39_130]OFZ74997.1 MAG: t